MLRIETPGELGEAIRAARKQLGLTQAKLAEKAGCGARFVVELEAGKPTVRLEQVLRVLNALGGALSLLDLPDPTHLPAPKTDQTASEPVSPTATTDDEAAAGLMGFDELLALAQALRTEVPASRPV